MLSSRLNLTLFAFLWLLLIVVGDDNTPLERSKWVPLPSNEGQTILWPSTKESDIIGVATAERGLWTFRLHRDVLCGKKARFRTYSRPFFETPRLLEGMFWFFQGIHRDQHQGNFRAAFILSSRSRDGSLMSPGLIAALTQELREQTGGISVEWGSLSDIALDLILSRSKKQRKPILTVQRGANTSTKLFQCQIAEDGEWIRDQTKWLEKPFSDGDDKKEPLDTLTTVQQLYDDESAHPNNLPYDPAHLEPSAEVVQFKWHGSSTSKQSLHRNDDNANPNDLTIIITTTTSAWVLAFPEKLVQEAATQLSLRGGAAPIALRGEPWFQLHVRDPLLGMWEDAIRPREKNAPTLSGQLVGISILIRNDQEGVLVKQLRHSNFIKTILEELWEESNHPEDGQKTRGPLRGDELRKIPFYSFVGADRYKTSDSDHGKVMDEVLAPTHYFMARSMSVSTLLGEWFNGKAGSLFLCLFGKKIVFCGTFAGMRTVVSLSRTKAIM